MMSSRRIKFFTGAPEAKTLDWSEDALSNTLLPVFHDHSRNNLTDLHDISTLSTALAKWRHIPLDGKTFYDPPAAIDSLPFHPFSTLVEDESAFLDHSLALLENLQSSQLTSASTTATSSSDEPSFLTTLSTLSPSIIASNPPRITAQLTALSALPSANHLLRLRPQTLTVSVCAGIISISLPRTVHVRRRGGYDMDVIEAVLGDETRAGFGVTIWLASERRVGEDALRKAIEPLRRGDVVVLERLALAVYGGVVYGQTLNRRGSGVVTRITRVEGDVDGEARGKVERVREWVGNFVGGERRVKRKAGEEGLRRSKRVQKRESWLPPDESQVG
ncbi:hypothetical protein K461DRAFT_119282 [Myriangium duriaei CBS 260.36]|uniref:Uncharacterized protein n=1 Tax=Myriangium duriaei CBS 260.36 TaxID=1168546 RepID=A0A9P4J7U3_9PEZI|nr:hypothetical protein K461DRAFT_119282 [Myriangium duriaei CBS 260.36]